MIMMPIAPIAILSAFTWPPVNGPLSLADWVVRGGGVVVCMFMAMDGHLGGEDVSVVREAVPGFMNVTRAEC